MCAPFVLAIGALGLDYSLSSGIQALGHLSSRDDAVYRARTADQNTFTAILRC